MTIMSDEKTINATLRFAANHPVNGAFYSVDFSNGLAGGVNIKPNGRTRPLKANLMPLEGHDFYDTLDQALMALFQTLSAAPEKKEGG